MMDSATGMAAASGIITVLKYILITLGGGIALGAVGGLIYAGIRYPNPNKRSIFTARQKVIMLICVLLGVGLIVTAFVYQPGEKDPGGDLMVNAMIDPATGMPMTDESGHVLGQDGMPLMDENGNYLDMNGMPVAPGDEMEPNGDEPVDDALPEGEDGEAEGADEDSSEADGEESSSDEDADSSSEDAGSDSGSTVTGGSVPGGSGGGAVAVIGGGSGVVRIG